jgi:hypothetical protein
MTNKIEYVKPEIADYGSIQEMTAGCHGSPSDYQGLNNALVNVTSRGTCTSTS